MVLLGQKNNQLACSVLFFAATALFLAACGLNRSGSLADYDEGLALMRAFLVDRGYVFHQQLWSDQPIAMSLIFAAIGNVFGFSLEPARLFVIFCSSLLCTLLFWEVSKHYGWLSGCIAGFFLLASSRFVQFGTAAMIGVPTLMFEFLAISLLLSATYNERCLSLRSKFLLLGSGGAFALALGSKLIALQIIPVIWLGIFFKASSNSSCWRATLARSFELLVPWVLGFLCIVLFLMERIGDGLPSMLSQLIGTNLMAHTVLANSEVSLIAYAFKRDSLIILLSAAAIPLSRSFSKREWILPFLWLEITLLGLAQHTPLFTHHYLTFAVPLFWLFGILVGELLQAEKEKIIPRPLAAGLITLSLLWFGRGMWEVPLNLKESRIPIESEQLATIEGLAPKVNWMITDQPIYGVLTGIPTPPELAVFSWKRQQVGALTASTVSDAVFQYKPEIVHLTRFPELADTLRTLLLENYQEAMPGFFVKRSITDSFDKQ